MTHFSIHPLPALAIAAAFAGSAWATRAAAQDISAAASSSAQDPSNNTIFRRHRAASDNALELQIAGGYQQGIGALGSTTAPHVQDVAGVGIGSELNVGFRISPRFLVGAYGSGAFYRAVGESSSARSFAMGVQGQFHLRPFRSIDPWLGLGIGYRVFSFDLPEQGSSIHKGIQLPRVALGVDYRPSPFVAVGPFVAVDFALFRGEAQPSGGATNTVASFVSVGISGRFDLLGRREKYASESADR